MKEKFSQAEVKLITIIKINRLATNQSCIFTLNKSIKNKER